MNVTTRNQQIKELRAKGVTFLEIAKKFHLSPERVRQITLSKFDNKDELYQRIDNIYKSKLISTTDYNWVKEEIRELSKLNRHKETVIRRRNLVRFLHDNLEFSFNQIALMMKRHHTTIMNLYNGESI